MPLMLVGTSMCTLCAAGEGDDGCVGRADRGHSGNGDGTGTGAGTGMRRGCGLEWGWRKGGVLSAERLGAWRTETLGTPPCALTIEGALGLCGGPCHIFATVTLELAGALSGQEGGRSGEVKLTVAEGSPPSGRGGGGGG